MADVGGDSERVSNILETLMAIAAGDFDARAQVTGRGDTLDALAAGISMLGEELVDKFAANQALTHSLERALAEAKRKNETIMMLSTPALSVWDGIVVVPLVGVLDEQRATEMSAALLERVQASAAQVVIIDVTGLATLDTSSAKHLLDTFAAVSLLGAQCILTGISPSNAQNMVGLGVSFAGIETQRTLREGLRLAFLMTGRRVQQRESPR